MVDGQKATMVSVADERVWVKRRGGSDRCRDDDRVTKDKMMQLQQFNCPTCFDQANSSMFNHWASTCRAVAQQSAVGHQVIAAHAS